MIVVADTSPLNYLILIGEIEILPKLYDKVLLPEEVHRELQRAQTPSAVREWAASLPTAVPELLHPEATEAKWLFP
ncbi:MAG: hypothetical protein ABSF23_16270 [Terracidiphilus sp.]|jgi:predicted nucleic acid-binding protein